MTSKKSKTSPVDEKILMRVLSTFGVGRIDVAKLNEVTSIPVQVIIEAIPQLISRGLVGVGSDAFTRYYYLTEKGEKLVKRQ